MNLGLLLSVSKTHLFARKKQTIIASLGVTFGIGTYIIMMSFMNGLNGLLDGLILNRTPHVHIYNEVQPTEKQPVFFLPQYRNEVKIVQSIKPKNKPIKIHNAKPLIRYLENNSSVLGVTPQVKAQAFYLAGSTQLNGMVTGINISNETTQYHLDDYIIEGTAIDLAKNDKGILLGAGIAKKLALKKGDYIQIGTIGGEIHALKIIGLYQSGMSDIDNVHSYVNLQMAQRILGESNDFITDINIKLKHMEESPAFARAMEIKFNITAVDIQSANAQFETGTFVRNLISYAVSITLLIVAGFGIYNILNMLIYEKMNDIAILKATGFSGPDVRWIFISQAIIIGVIGGVLGLILGYIVSSIIDHTPFNTQAMPTIKTYPIKYEVKYYLIGLTFALVSTFFAGYFPSRKAEKMDPVDIIRGQ